MILGYSGLGWKKLKLDDKPQQLTLAKRPCDTAGQAPVAGPIVKCVFANVAYFCAQRHAFGDEESSTARELPRDAKIAE